MTTKTVETTSSISAYLRCPKLHEYKYIKKYDSPNYSQALVLGSLVHAGVECWFKGIDFATVAEKMNGFIKEFPENVEDINRDNLLASKIVLAWSRYYSEVDSMFNNKKIKPIDIEQKWSWSVTDDFELHGVRDGYFEHADGNFLYELKTASSTGKDQYKLMLEANAQINNNLIALNENDEPVKGVIYDIIWKPAIRQKKSETEEEFWERYADEYFQEPGKYFERFVVIRKQEKLDEHVTELRAIASAMQNGKPYRNTQSCRAYNSLCPFFHACMDNDDSMLIGFKKRETKHREIK